MTGHPNPTRRTFLGGAAGAAATLGVLGALPAEAAQALAEPRRRGRLDDVEHVVILMQENRSFDHYYGTMRGVRGYGDRAAIRDVFRQPDAARGTLLPFHVDTTKVDGQDLSDLDHSWDGTHLAWAGGDYDAWVAAKTELTMGYFTGADLPFHRALAGAFTICDNYFCSVQGPTTPNRLYLWSATIDPAGRHGGPVTSNPADYAPVFSWTTYPERLQAAGISWQVYANDEVGDDGDHPFAGDYGDNPLWLFHAYHDALNSTDPTKRQLAERGGLHRTWQPDSGKGKDVDHVLAPFIADCAANRLPAVSWIVAPYGYSEHPQARPVDGAAYTAGVLAAIWGNPALRGSTALFIDFDENDGFFDHVPPPVAPTGTPGEFIGGRPIGLGPRVPMTVISPWSRGGWVNSQVFDHTSVLRFLETWTGVREPNISAWRRAICGDLTSCFDFERRDTTIPSLPDTAVLRAAADRTQSKLPKPAPPTGSQVAPAQETGTALARALPYQPTATGKVRGTAVALTLGNAGSAALQLTVRGHHLPATLPLRVDVAPGQVVTSGLATAAGAYDIAVHGPNGFVRELRGDTATTAAGVEAAVELTGTAGAPTLTFTLRNTGGRDLDLSLADALGTTTSYHLAAGASRTVRLDPLRRTDGWYDLGVTVDGLASFVRRFAGHLENGRPSRTG